MRERINLKKDEYLQAQVKDLLKKLLLAQENNNWQAFQTCFAHNENVLHIGTDIDEIWIGWNSFKSWMQNAFKHDKEIHITDKETKITISNDGNTAWYSQLIDTSLEPKGEMMRIEGFRHTGVIQKFGNKWLIVQSHTSAPLTEHYQRVSDAVSFSNYA